MNITIQRDHVWFTPGRVLVDPEVAPHVPLIPYVQLKSMLIDHCRCTTVEWDGQLPRHPLSRFADPLSLAAVARFGGKVITWQWCATIPGVLWRFCTDFETGITEIDSTYHLEGA